MAAGPHTQLAINIIAAWLCGARYIELKTVQTLDDLEVSKPCIAMQDEGYNCEWSQELKIKQSFDEYLNAWIIIHVLRKELGFSGPSGTLFNMSVGYDFAGITGEKVQWFFSRMSDCRGELSEKIESVSKFYPAIRDIEIPSVISDNITLSTMHGCPPEEIEKIALYLIREKGLHTSVKLNPTLLGAGELRKLLNDELGFNTVVPDLAFEHDLKFTDALKIISNLSKAAHEKNLQFGVKLTNTLESENVRGIFPEKEKMMYMSGRALHPLSVRVALKLQHEFNGELDISFSAGADCFNLPDLIGCGLKPVTVCSDLLKPGGYGRLKQYLENLHQAMNENGSLQIDEFIVRRPGSEQSVREAALENLSRYSDKVAQNPSYRKSGFSEPDIKTKRGLGFFDCIHAPCIDTCATHQDIPGYLRNTAKGDFSSAFEVIMETNPFPTVTGMICDHLCQLKCTRIHYDEALQIRDIKRFNAESGSHPLHRQKNVYGKKVAIVGAGPAGLSCAWFLWNAGIEPVIYEQKDHAGGMVSSAIPSFRLSDDAVRIDLRRILEAGIKIHVGSEIDEAKFKSLKENHDAVFLAAGAQRSVQLNIEGIHSAGVLDPLSFLFAVRDSQPVNLGKNIVIIGGGNTAMDAARTAFRVAEKGSKVTIVYRRTIKEMPADKGEIQAVIEEGIEIKELINPERITVDNGKVTSIVCSRNKLEGTGRDGRSIPKKISGSEFEIQCDTIIPAIGQDLAFDFFKQEELQIDEGSYRTKMDKVYIGGDAMRGASTAIHAIADGRLAAMEIAKDLGDSSSRIDRVENEKADIEPLLYNKSQRRFGYKADETPADDRRNFNQVISTLSEEMAVEEASRCLQCDVICNVCVSVCPNLANFSYEVEPVVYKLQKVTLNEDGPPVLEEDQIFRIEQDYQVLNIRDFCNECGNCKTFCPSSGSPYQDKPGFCISEEAFAEEPNGYILRQNEGNLSLIHKFNNETEILTLTEGRYHYQTNKIKAAIDPGTFQILGFEFQPGHKGTVSFSSAVEMSIILHGARQLTSTFQIINLTK